MSKIVLLSINAKYIHSSLAVWYLSNAIARYSRSPHEVTVVESTINQPCTDIAELTVKNTPDIIGIGVYIWNAGILPELITVLRGSLPDAKIVLGGPEASHNAGFWLSQNADFVLRGEGEVSLPALIDIIDGSGEKMLESVTGLSWKRNGVLHSNGAPELCSELIDPYGVDYFNALNGRIAYIETSRGCPFACAFCLSGESTVRFFPMDTAKDNFYKLSLSGTKTIKLVDRTFNCNPARAYTLFEYAISLNTSCCFHFEVAADLFDERTITLLSSAPPGRIQLEAGLQSFYEPALTAASRHTDLKKAEQNIRALVSHRNIHIHVDLIAGLPYETFDIFQDSFNNAYSLGAHTLQLGFLKLLHGSKLREQADNFQIEYETNPPYEIIRSPWLNPEEISVLKQVENALQHTRNKCRFLAALEYTLSVSGLQPFSFYRGLGAAAPNNGMHLDIYAEQIYAYCAGLPGVDKHVLCDHMLCDWLGMVKGRNTPRFLKNKSNKPAALAAEKLLGYKPERGATAVLSSGRGVYADIHDRDPVTGLYKINFIDL